MTMPPDTAQQPEFIRRQYAFAAHIRDPLHAPAPADVAERRMAIYRELFYNNVEGFLSTTFPVLRALHDDTRWHAMAREFFATHRSRSPLFLEIPREFLHWLEHERTAADDDLPFLYQMAHYEWLELAVSIQEEPPSPLDIDPEGDLLSGSPVLSPLARHLSYDWPVHRIGPEFIPVQRSATHLVVYRKPDDEVGFLEVNSVTKRLLELVDGAAGRSGAGLLQQIADELSHPQPETVISSGLDILADLRGKSIISGTRSSATTAAT